MAIVKFVDKPDVIEHQGALDRVPRVGTLKYCTRDGLPASDQIGVLFFTTDTHQFFRGAGTGRPLEHVADIYFYERTDLFPKTGVEGKIYLSKASRTPYFWDGQKYVPMATGDGSGTLPDDILENLKHHGYQQIAVVDDPDTFSVKLDHTPIEETIGVYVNGIYYTNDCIYYDSESKTVHWLWDKNGGGFDLESGFEVVIQYDYYLFG